LVSSRLIQKPCEIGNKKMWMNNLKHGSLLFAPDLD